MTNDQIAEYVEQTAKLIDLPIAPDYRPGIVKNFVAISAIAQLITEFPLAEDIEAAPVFEP